MTTVEDVKETIGECAKLLHVLLPGLGFALVVFDDHSDTIVFEGNRKLKQVMSRLTDVLGAYIDGDLQDKPPVSEEAKS